MTTTLRWAEGKDPADVWPYSIDATDAMTRISDTLASATCTASPSGLTVGAVTTTPAGIATAILSAGTAGITYTVTFRLTTTGGRILERSVLLTVSEL